MNDDFDTLADYLATKDGWDLGWKPARKPCRYAKKYDPANAMMCDDMMVDAWRTVTFGEVKKWHILKVFDSEGTQIGLDAHALLCLICASQSLLKTPRKPSTTGLAIKSLV